MQSGSKLEKYFASYQRRISEDFRRIRDIYSDSSVKGSNNEKIISEFLSEHLNCNFISNNNQIIDSLGNASDEVDICVCNLDQPFKTKTGELILCEGVDFVVQVKAIISNNEIDRIIKNCLSVKKLVRQLTLGMTCKGYEGDYEYMVQKVPYIVFAFDSKTSFQSLFFQLRKRFKDVDLNMQPDAIFILNKGFFINLRNGNGAPVKADNISLKGIVGFEAPEFTLLEMIKYVNTQLPKIIRPHSPMSYYYNNFLDKTTVYSEQLIRRNIIRSLQHVSRVSPEKLNRLVRLLKLPNKVSESDEQILLWASQLSVFTVFLKDCTEKDWVDILNELSSSLE